jgi:23S rRNA pseudouridine1911/1915/1917 synthase
MPTDSLQSLCVSEVQRGIRLDQFLSAQSDRLSRSGWKALILSGGVKVNGAVAKPNYKVKAGEEVSWMIADAEESAAVVAEPIDFAVLYEDESLLVLNKPAGLVVHPGAGVTHGTLVSGLLYHGPEFGHVERAGIVHRLDRETSGVMVVAKTGEAMRELQRQFKARETEKEYLAVVWGEPRLSGRIETLIGRHRVQRQKMAVLREGGREAITNYWRDEQFSSCALMRIRIETGRTHQIRVHMAHLGHPVVGDLVYGRARKAPFHLPTRQMLHAQRLSIVHPNSGKRLSFEAPLFEDMQTFLETLRKLEADG